MHRLTLVLANIHLVDCHLKIMMTFTDGSGQSLSIKWLIALTREEASRERAGGLKLLNSSEPKCRSCGSILPSWKYLRDMQFARNCQVILRRCTSAKGFNTLNLIGHLGNRHESVYSDYLQTNKKW